MARQQGGALADRTARSVCAQCSDPYPRSGRSDRGLDTGMGLDQSGAGRGGQYTDRRSRPGAGSTQLRIAEVPVMVATGWTEAQKKAYAIADNKLALNA